MASSLAEKINQNFLQCGICLEPFRNPRALPCLHSFCEECLERWVKTKKEKDSTLLICPNCKKPAQIPAEGVQGFPAHFLSLQETVNMEKAREDYSEKLCSKCNRHDNKATVYCCDCKHFLCESCFDSHKAWEGLKHHRVITIEDLSSGKVTLLESDTQDQYCADHEGEQKRFYCETCGKPVCRDCIVMKQYCRDHEYVTLKEASNKKASQLQETMQECDKMRKKCQEAIEKADKVKSELAKFADSAKVTMEETRKDYMQQLEKVFSRKESKMNQERKQRNDTLDQLTNKLREDIVKIESAGKQGKTLTDTGSYYDITAKSTSVLKSLQDATRIHIANVDDDLAVLSTSVVSTYTVGRKWKRAQEIDVPDPTNRERGPIAVAVTSDLKIVVTFLNNIRVYTKSGSNEHCFNEMPCNGEDVVVSADNQIAFLRYNPKVCKIYNSRYKEIKTYTIDHSECHAVLTMDKNGCLIVGLYDGTICFHDSDDGSLKSSFKLHSRPTNIALPVVGEIAIVTTKGTLETLDYSGKSIQTFQPPPEVNTWEPVCICCSKRYEVFVVNEGDPKAIYRYTAGGEYMGCITTEINDVRGIAISQDDQELFATEYSDKLVKIFQRP